MERTVSCLVLHAAVTGLLILTPAHAAAQARKAPAAAPDTSAITPAMIADGRVLFHGPGGCQACHGARLEGTAIAPPLRSHKWKDAVGGTYRNIYRVITDGVRGTAMVAHPNGIGSAQAHRIAAYIWAVNHRGTKP